MPADRAPPAYPVPLEFDDDRFRWLFQYWTTRLNDGRLPGRQDINPLDFRELLGRIYLIEVVREAERIRFRFRLWGSKISGIFGQQHTGHWLEDIAAPGTFDELERTLLTCTIERRPFFWRRPMMDNNPGYVATRRLLLPLAADGETVDMLFGLILEEAKAG